MNPRPITSIVAAASVLATLTACSGYGQSTATTTPASAHAPAHAPAPPPSDGHGEIAIDSGHVAPRPQERPGLGTTWGETRWSKVTARPFERAASSPFAQVALHYNDHEGVAAHADYVGGARPAPYTAYTPHGGISISLVDEHGRILPGLAANGRVLIAGTEGQRYAIAVQNHTAGRYEIVASVDGLDVVDGRPADLGKRGYVVEPGSSIVIDGFRQSDSYVAAFRFGRVAASYAARTSGDRNVGVVGLAFFAERGSPWSSDELVRRDTANPFPGDRSYARPPR